MNRYLGVVAVLAVLGGCGRGGDSGAAPARVATAAAGGLEVDLLADGRLETGRSRVYLAVRTAAGAPVTDATVTFEPRMAMEGDSHGAPVLGPPALGEDGTYRCDVVFQMPTVAGGTWGATVGIARPGEATVQVELAGLPVTDSGRARTFAHTDPETSAVTRYVASLNLDARARVGLNPVTVTLHVMEDPTTFTPVDDAALHLDPQMPSMGHGSPGSVDPVRRAPGIYEGLLSFSMPGDWETTVTVERGGVAVGAPRFALLF